MGVSKDEHIDSDHPPEYAFRGGTEATKVSDKKAEYVVVFYRGLKVSCSTPMRL